MARVTDVPTAWEALDTLKTALDLTDGAAVFFVLVPPGEARKRWQARLRRLLAGRPVVEVPMSPERPLRVEEVQPRLEILRARGARPVLFVDVDALDLADLDLSFSGGLAERIERARRVLQSLNLKREALARLEVPVVFWMPSTALRAFALWAADLFSVKSGVFDLESPYLETHLPLAWGTQTLAIKGFTEEPEDRALWDLPEAEIRGRIRLYEDQLEREARKRSPHLPRLAALRIELARLYRRLGEHLRTIEHLKKAVDIYRHLVEENPDAFLPDLAMALNNLGARLAALGRREEALAATREAVDIRRELARRHPDRFLPDLARSLGAHGLVLLQAGRPAEAAAALREGLQHLLPRARAWPQALGALLGGLLADYLTACREAGLDPDEALVQQARSALP